MGRTTLTRPWVAREGVVLVTGVCGLVLLCYDQIFVARGVLWMAPAVAVALAYPTRVVQARLSPMLLAFVGWLLVVSLHAGLPRGTFMLELLIGAIAAGAAVSTLGLDSLGRRLLTASGILVTVSVAACIAHMNFAFEADPLYAGAWRGVFFQKNTLGFAAALLVLMCVGYFREVPRNGVYALLSVGLLALFEARSISALGALLYAVVVFAVLEAARRRGRFVRPRHVIALLALVFVAFFALLPHVLGRVGRDPTLTGRTIVWSILSKDARADTTFGHGVGAYWFDKGSQGSLYSIEQQLHFVPESAHNGALDAALDGGLPGLVLLVAVALVATRRASIAYQHGCSWPLLLLAFAIMSTATERGLYSGPMLFVVAAVLSAPSVSASAA